MPVRVAPDPLGRDDVRPTPAEILTVVREALAIVCERPLQQISRDTELAALGADSLARVELAELIEERLAEHAPSLSIPDAELEAFRTVGDTVDYVVAMV
jgi:acyl carrier protein